MASSTTDFIHFNTHTQTQTQAFIKKQNLFLASEHVGIGLEYSSEMSETYLVESCFRNSSSMIIIFFYEHGIPCRICTCR